MKKTFAGLSDGAQATFDVIAVGPDGLRAARRNAHWSLYRISNDYQWYKQDGRWNFEQVKSSSRVAEGVVDLATDAARRSPRWSVSAITASTCATTIPTDAQTSVTFDVGWSGEAKAQTPDLLDVTLDKPAYASGDTDQAENSLPAPTPRRRWPSSATA